MKIVKSNRLNEEVKWPNLNWSPSP